MTTESLGPRMARDDQHAGAHRVRRPDDDHPHDPLPVEGSPRRGAPDRHEGRHGRELRPARHAAADRSHDRDAERVDEALRWLERRGTQEGPRGDADAVRHHRAQGLRRVGRHDPAARQEAGPGPRPRRRPVGHRAGTRRASSPPTWTTRPRSPRRRWIAGPGTSTTGASATRSASRCSTGHPHAWKKVEPWSQRREEFVKRAAFALVASLALHDKKAGDGAVPPDAPAHRARCVRRPQLRQERGELGASRRGAEESRAERGRGRGRAAAGGIARGGGPVGGKGRDARSSPARRCGASSPSSAAPPGPEVVHLTENSVMTTATENQSAKTGTRGARGVLLDQHADAEPGGGVRVLRQVAGLDLRRHPGDGLPHPGRRERRSAACSTCTGPTPRRVRRQSSASW